MFGMMILSSLWGLAAALIRALPPVVPIGPLPGRGRLCTATGHRLAPLSLSGHRPVFASLFAVRQFASLDSFAGSLDDPIDKLAPIFGSRSPVNHGSRGL